MIDIISRIADLQNYPKPNPRLGIGRECYAFSDLEDKAFDVLEVEAERIFQRRHVTSERYDIGRDAVGNLFVTVFGTDRSKTVMSGSHVDSVHKGGVYDGVAGVYSAFRFLEKLLQSGQTAAYNYTAVVFRAEEASPKTGFTCLGSRVATGALSEQELLKIQYKTDSGESIAFADFFSKKYGRERWQAVIAELEEPSIKKDRIIAYEELHIEQSAVCEMNDCDVGIVIDGIGGARREVLHMPLASRFLPEIAVEAGQYWQYAVKFIGEEAHTGGTPPNPTFTRQEGSPWYRKDALIGSAVFMQKLPESARVTYYGIPQEVGFTTVPKEQQVRLLVPTEAKPDFDIYLATFRNELARDSGVEMSAQAELAMPGAVKYYDTRVLEALEIPLFVEQLVREQCREQIRSVQGGVGRVRATVTDFRISQEPAIRCNLDFRDVDPLAIQQIVRAVHERVQQVAIRIMDPTVFLEHIENVIRTISQKPYIPMDEQAIRDKTLIAEKLGYKVMHMPSLPGHDAASLGAIGAPIAMTFVSHDGRSHSGYETMSQAAYEKAEKLSHAYLAEKLGIVLS